MKKIAIIDDDLAMEMIVDNLQWRGFEAVRFSTATKALVKIDDISHFDLVVLDMIMSWPEGRAKSELSGSHCAGMEVYRELRVRNKDIPIVVFSVT